MTDEQKRIAIAEKCGWKRKKDGWHLRDNHSELPGELIWPEPPDYLNDLNAMHGAEKLFFPTSSKEWARYTDCLISVCINTEHKAISAPAAFRAEALLGVLK